MAGLLTYDSRDIYLNDLLFFLTIADIIFCVSAYESKMCYICLNNADIIIINVDNALFYCRILILYHFLWTRYQRYYSIDTCRTSKSNASFLTIPGSNSLRGACCQLNSSDNGSLGKIYKQCAMCFRVKTALIWHCCTN